MSAQLTALKSLHTYCGHLNLGGLIKIEYAPTAWVDKNTYEHIISQAYNWQYNILFTQGGWLQAYALPEKRAWQETQRPSKQGDYYEQRLQATAPHLRPEVSGELNKMRHYRYLLRLTDKNRRPWLLGTLEHGFLFSANAISGEGTTSLNHYRLTFQAQTVHRAYGFNPIISL